MTSPCWEIKTVSESHTHRKSFGGEVCYRKVGKRKGCSNQIGPLDESQDGGNFLVDGAILHRYIEKNTHIGMPYTTATDIVSLYLSVMEAMDNFGFEENIVEITIDGGGNIGVCRKALESKYTNDSAFHHPIPY